MHPLNEYRTRCNCWRAEHNLSQRQFIRIGNWRLLVACVAAVLAWLSFISHVLSPWWLSIPILVFITLAAWQQRAMRRRTIAERAVRYYESGLARLEDHWIGTGNPGNQFRDESHVYAEDLDIFGKGGLFELISIARTTTGEQTLASWLLSPASREQALARQDAIRELSGRVDLREDIALLGEDVRSEADPANVVKWAAAPPVHFSPLLRAFAVVLAFGAAGTLIAFLAQVIPLWPFAVFLVVNFLLIFLLRGRISRVVGNVDTPAQDLRILSLLLKRLEGERFTTRAPNELRANLEVEGLAASRRIARLERWFEWLESADHVFVRILRPIILWREQIGMAIEAWRQQSGRYIETWIRAAGEFEALSSFAALAFERPHWTFPELTSENQARFEAEALQHPLISAVKCVPNDVSIGPSVSVLIVSGSNMSGKSTLLRAVGLNAVLAWAGAPVAAKWLRISPLQPGASIRVVDSLQDNRSRFLTEITRIRQIVDLTQGARPVLFLLDELLSGTNSHDRLIGASGIVRALVYAGAVGLLTTHDLALARLEQDLGGRAANVHFEDQIVDGRIEFDYRLRPGIVAHSNALELMRAVGLAV